MDFMDVHAVDFPCASGLEGLGNDVNNQYEIASHITVLVITPDRQIEGQLYGPNSFPTQDTLNSLLLSLGAELLDCSVGISENKPILNKENTLKIYPNPIVNRAEANVEIEKSGLYNIRIFNNFGALVYTKPTLLTKGENLINIDFTPFKKGVYFINVQGDGELIMNKKVLKQ